MRLVLHIGSTKTGSSALQSTLFDRRDALAAAGVLYSTAGVAAGAHHLLAAAIHHGAWQMHPDAIPDDRAAYFADTARAIREEAITAGAHTIVVSSEYFWESFAPGVYKTFAAAFAPMSFELVAFIRRQDEWAMSSYLQAVKNGESQSFSEWAQRRILRPNSGLHYFRVINRWAYFLAADPVHVIRYQDAKANVYKAFCEAIGIEVDTDIAMGRVNPSPSPEGLRRLLEVNRADLDEESKKRERRAIMRTHQAEGGSTLLLSEAERETVLKGEQASDRLIAQRFLGRDGPLFDPAPAVEPPSLA